MPFVGVREGEKVVPEEVEDDEIVECPECGEPMKPRSSHHRKIKGNKVFIARHFWHFENPGNKCGGGESYEHQRMKSIALSKLKETFDYSDSGLEKKIGERRPDVYAKFSEPRNPYGKGIVVEAQYRHESKDKESTIENYFDCGYSVCWLEEDDFSNRDVNLRKNVVPVWPARAPDHSWENSEDISSYGSRGHLFMNVLDEVLQPQVPPRKMWRGKPANISKLVAESKVRSKFWMSWYPWPMRVPPPTEWENRRAELPRNDDWRGLELRYKISEDDISTQELVIIKILGDLGPSPVQEIWPRFAHRVNTRGMGVRDLINKLESMPSVRKTRGGKWKYTKHH